MLYCFFGQHFNQNWNGTYKVVAGCVADGVVKAVVLPIMAS